MINDGWCCYSQLNTPTQTRPTQPASQPANQPSSKKLTKHSNQPSKQPAIQVITHSWYIPILVGYTTLQAMNLFLTILIAYTSIAVGYMANTSTQLLVLQLLSPQVIPSPCWLYPMPVGLCTCWPCLDLYLSVSPISILLMPFIVNNPMALAIILIILPVSHRLYLIPVGIPYELFPVLVGYTRLDLPVGCIPSIPFMVAVVLVALTGASGAALQPSTRLRSSLPRECRACAGHGRPWSRQDSTMNHK